MGMDLVVSEIKTIELEGVDRIYVNENGYTCIELKDRNGKHGTVVAIDGGQITIKNDRVVEYEDIE